MVLAYGQVLHIYTGSLGEALVPHTRRPERPAQVRHASWSPWASYWAARLVLLHPMCSSSSLVASDDELEHLSQAGGGADKQAGIAPNSRRWRLNSVAPGAIAPLG